MPIDTPKDDDSDAGGGKRIPPNAPSVEAPSGGGGGSRPPGLDDPELEFQFLETDRELKRLLSMELRQRIRLRWIAVFVGISVIVGMAWGVVHLVHHVIWGPFILANAAFSVAMIVAPIVSITTITVAIFVAAFRKFDDKDMEDVGNGVSNGFRLWKNFH